uniref:G protein-coupled receptor kinase n=1 Tax=Denticeps clupeoides TaxID=299321 RepID=A0AAY4CQI4_9TELE
MCDMEVLGNLVANTTYLKAQGGDDKDMKKRCRSLVLPKLEKCAEIRTSVGSDFHSLCEQQPIGRRLFQEFLLASEPAYAAAARLLDNLNNWDLAEDSAKDKERQNIINKLCRGKNFLVFISDNVARKLRTISEEDFEELMMGKVKVATREFLMGKPFMEYLISPFFDKFLQWKAFERQPITEKYFYEFRTLGKGGFGEVCAVQVKITGQMYACKKLDKKRLKRKGGEKMALLEKLILEKVNSRFIVNLVYAYATRTHLCLVISLMNGGDLKYHIYKMGEHGLSMDRVRYYTAQITTGILHLHALDIVYRDMKPENVLLDSNGQCRLSDLGLAVELPSGKTICQKAGTSGYMAPEILKQEPYRTSVDWWALGCSLYEMVAGRLPFKNYKEKVQREEVARRTLEDECMYEHKNFDSPTKNIIDLFLKKKTEDRLGCNFQNEPTHFLGDDPRTHEWFKSINLSRLEAGLIKPSWVPSPNVVYAKDTGDIHDFSEAKGVEFDANDEKFFKEFNTGAVPIPWQQEITDSGLFEDLNDPNRKDSSPRDDKKSQICTLL